MENEIKQIIKFCKEFKMQRFKEDDKSIRNAFHIPYSGWGNPDYVSFWDYLTDDILSLMLEVIEDKEIDSIEELKDEWNDLDYDGHLHDHIESSLTWQQGLRECEIILNNCSDYEQDDSGLWEGLTDLNDIANAKAFWTYKAMVEGKGREFIEAVEDGETPNNAINCIY